MGFEALICRAIDRMLHDVHVGMLLWDSCRSVGLWEISRITRAAQPTFSAASAMPSL